MLLLQGPLLYVNTKENHGLMNVYTAGMWWDNAFLYHSISLDFKFLLEKEIWPKSHWSRWDSAARFLHPHILSIDYHVKGFVPWTGAVHTDLLDHG